MITKSELNPHNYPTTPELDINAGVLLDRLNQIRTAYAKPMIVTSGLRTQVDQMRINPKAPTSKHITFQACDISDSDGALKEWINKNITLLEHVGLWCEAFSSTPTWVHFQTVPPKSGKRFFLP